MNTRLELMVGLAIVSGTAPACNWHQDEVPAESAAPAPQAELPAPGKPDPWITTQLQARFFADPVIRGNDVTVATADGVVTLTGTVPSQAARDRAASLAREIDGVANVDNRLALEAHPIRSSGPPATEAGEAGRPGLQAGWTTTKIQAQLFAAPEVKGRNIDVTTDANGVVTLRGRVDSAAAKSAAIRIAGATDGVSRVVDELRVEAEPQTTVADAATTVARDAWTTASIQSKYFLDADVKGRHIDVKTENGIVTLTGEVENPAEHRQALDLARTTAFVRDVVDRLRLEATSALTGEPKGPADVVPQLSGKSHPPAPPDSWIRTAILSKFFLSEQVQTEVVEVAASNGVVTLSGTVRDADARSTAAEIARGTNGVRRVVNQIMVAGS